MNTYNKIFNLYIHPNLTFPKNFANVGKAIWGFLMGFLNGSFKQLLKEAYYGTSI